MASKKSTFAVFLGNRGFFPASLMASARQDLTEVLHKLGHETLFLDEHVTRHGAVETVKEGQVYANFLARERGKYDGVILSLPNFGDETGAIAALKDAGVPILIQAYPDELDKMAPASRRDAFCGKFSVMDVFCQYGLKFTALQPHTVHPRSPRFAANIDYFDRLCRVVKAMKSMVVGAIGARTTAFKTVRIDELALQRHAITMETLDLADVFARMNALSASDETVKAKAALLRNYSNWNGVPEAALEKISRLGVVFDTIIDEYKMDAVAIRCWSELEVQLRISPCVLLSELNDRGVPAACEVDVGNAVTMYGLSRAAEGVATCLDWNNNYGDDDSKCILFHCGPVPQSLMTAKGQISDHLILANAFGAGCGWGCNVGRIAPTPFTFGSLLTEGGKLKFYVGQGRITEDVIPKESFGCAGVAQIDHMQDVFQTIGYAGHRHHVSVTPGHVAAPVTEAFERYLGYEVTRV
jgi:L-fucose isomerase-like protein